MVSCKKGGERFNLFGDGLDEQRMLLRPQCSTRLVGNYSYSTLEAYKWWGTGRDIVPRHNLFSVSFIDETTCVCVLVLTYFSWPARLLAATLLPQLMIALSGGQWSAPSIAAPLEYVLITVKPLIGV